MDYRIWSGPFPRISRIFEQYRNMLFHVCFVKLRKLVKLARLPNVVHYVLARQHPTWRALIIEDQAEFFVRRFDTDMFDVAARQTTAANEPIPRRARPTYFH
jgi:hypothetical protein